MSEEEQQFAEKVISDLVGGLGVLVLFVGDALSLFRHLHSFGDQGCNARELAACAKCHPRYVLEWLKACGSHGYVKVLNDAATDAEDWSLKFALPAAFADPLLNQTHASYIAPFTQWLPSLAQAARTGGPLLGAFQSCDRAKGVPFTEYHPEGAEAIASGNRPMFENELVQEWLPKLPRVLEKLKKGGWILDLGCGKGWWSLCAARGLPNVNIHAVDMDELSIEAARESLAQQPDDMQRRVHFSCADAGLFEGRDGGYDLVNLFECLHDMADPLTVLKHARRFVHEDGVVLVADERVTDAYSKMLPSGTENFMGRLNFSFSVLHCLPASIDPDPENSAAIGTCIRPSTVQRLSKEAGFSACEVVHENDCIRFYKMTV